VSAIIDDFDDDDDGAVFPKTIFFASSLSSTLSSRRFRRRRELLVVVPSKNNARRTTTTSAKKTDEDEKTEEATSSDDNKIDGNEPSKMKKEDEKSGSGGASTNNNNSWTSANQRRQEQQQQSHSPRSPSSPPPNRSVMLVNRATKIVATYALVSFLAYAYEAAFGTSDGNPYAAKERRARVLQVSYSKFLRDARRNEIGTVTVAGDRLTWKPRKPTVIDAGGDGRKSGNEGKRGQERRGGETTTTLSKSDGSKSFEIHYATRKPADAQTPYAQLEKNDVELFSVDADGDKNAFDFPFLVFASIVLFFWLRNIRENSMMMGSGGGMPGGRGGMPGGGMPGGIPGAGRQVGGRSFNGRGRNDPNFTPPPSTTFEDVAGVDEAKEELSEIVDILKNPERYSKLGARPPCGVLLCGSPGTGKTLLARAVAGEAGVPFISVAASEFVELYVGMGASRVRDVFARARAQAPAIVFIDEIDAVAKGRSDGKMRGMGNDEREQTLNQLLTELDGFDADASRLVICIGATNRPDTLDAALRRPGRFDRIVQVDKPDVQGRREILDVHVQTRGLPLENNVQQNDGKKHLLDEIATMTSGFTGADLENLVNEAALLAGRENKTTVGKEEFEKAVLRTVAGVEKKRSLLGPREKFNVSAHEVGHAIVSQAVGTLLPGSTKPEQISIVARSGGALGFTYTPPNTDEPERKLMFADELRGQIATFMGGRAAEMIACKRVSTGASDDIQRATMLAYKGFAEWGLSASVGPISIPTLSSGGNPEDWSFSDRAKESGHDVEGEVTGLLNAALVVACETLQLNEALLREASEVLAKEERVQGDALRAYLDRAKAPASLAKFLEGKYDIPTREDFRRLNAMPLPEFEVARALSSDNSNHNNNNNNNSVDGGDNNSSNNSSNDTNKVAPR
jgi:cell division protease FtsH